MRIEKEEPDELKTKVFLKTEESMIYMREKTLTFLFMAFGFLIFTTMSIIFFQGFNLWGFKLDIKLLNWLGAATIGELGGLLLIVYRFLFR